MVEGLFQTLFYYHVLLLTLFFFWTAAGRIQDPARRLTILTGSYLGFLAVGLFSSQAIWLASLAWTLVCVLGFLIIAKNLIRGPVRWPKLSGDRLLALSLFVISSAGWIFVLKDTASLPSRDDGTFHLFYFTRMLDTGEVFTGRIPFLFSELFGTRNQSFYPTGSHFLASIVTSPLRVALGISKFLQLKLFLIFCLSAFPAWMYLGCRRHFPDFKKGAVYLSSIALLSISVFPFNALGEGGFSRIVGLAISTPFVWLFLDSKVKFQSKILLAAVLFPALFFIHPTSIFLPLLAVVVSFFQNERLSRIPLKQWLLYAGCTGFAGVFVLLLLRSGEQIVTQGFVLEVPAELSRLSWLSAFERLKGPFHYFFGDGFGFWKFFSPRSLLAYFGIWLILRKMPQLRGIWLTFFLLPFVLAALIFIPAGPSRLVSVLFYHSVRRMAELSYFPLFLAWVVALNVLMSKARWIQWATTLLLVCVTAVGTLKGYRFLQARDLEFKTPRISEINQMIETVLSHPPVPDLQVACRTLPSQVIIALDPIKDHFKWVLWTLECNPENLPSPHCQKRKAAIEQIHDRQAEGENTSLPLPWETCVAERPLRH